MINHIRVGLMVCLIGFGSAHAADKNPQAILHTSLGDVTVELDQAKAPGSVKNFIRYAEEGFYNGTIFHRVIEGFMAQGGGFTESFEQKATHEPIQNEADNGLTNTRGTLAMARTNNPHSATAQFFINLVDNDYLNHTGKNDRGWGYAVFGKVTKGMNVVDKMTEIETGSKGFHQNVPMQNIVIKSVEIVK